MRTQIRQRPCRDSFTSCPGRLCLGSSNVPPSPTLTSRPSPPSPGWGRGPERLGSEHCGAALTAPNFSKAFTAVSHPCGVCMYVCMHECMHVWMHDLPPAARLLFQHSTPGDVSKNVNTSHALRDMDSTKLMCNQKMDSILSPSGLSVSPGQK